MSRSSDPHRGTSAGSPEVGVPGSSSGASHHVVPPAAYLAVFGALMLLTAVTVAVAYFDLGRLNLVVALTIALLKATLVVLYFMHARYAGGVTRVFIVAGLLWLALLVGITLSDYVSRAWENVPQGWG